MSNYSLCILKPDIIERGLEDEIFTLITRSGLLVSKKVTISLTIDDVNTLYFESRDQSYFKDIVNYMTRGKVVAMIVYGNDALELLNVLVGATDPAKAKKDTIRAIYGNNILENSVHSSNLNRVDYEIMQIYKLQSFNQNDLGIEL